MSTEEKNVNPFHIDAPSVSASAPLLEDGYYQAVVVAVSDCGEEDNFNKDGKVKKIRLFFALNETYDFKEEKKNYVFSKKFTSSLHDRSSLRKMLDEITKNAFDASKGLDISKLLGKSMKLNIEKKQSKTNPDKEYNNIVSFKPGTKEVVAIESVFITKFFVEEAKAWLKNSYVTFWDVNSTEDGEDDTPNTGSAAAEDDNFDLANVLGDL